ncbi:MAG TPA: hypothetical protein VGY91_07575 [Chthoniobacterales bacterium]|nr:hypothetical protein [Chthoniobacterales bacterium]
MGVGEQGVAVYGEQVGLAVDSVASNGVTIFHHLERGVETYTGLQKGRCDRTQ